MNKLHLEYLRDTGKHPTFELFPYDLEGLTHPDDEIIENWIAGLSQRIFYTEEYVEWLENKLS